MSTKPYFTPEMLPLIAGKFDLRLTGEIVEQEKSFGCHLCSETKTELSFLQLSFIASSLIDSVLTGARKECPEGYASMHAHLSHVVNMTLERSRGDQ